jgi:hypothetical protein
VALYHVHADVISKGQARGGAAGFSAYLQREDRDRSTQMARYLHREGWSAEDLVATGEGGLPAWAPRGTLFFRAADVYERQNATVARTYEIALPRELSPDQRLDLAADLRATFFEQYPHVWAIHNPVDASGADHPHLHLMLSERRETDGHARGPALYFRQAAGPRHDPATHGVRKERSWQGPARLREIRAGIALLINAALERAGVATAVSHESLRSRMSPRAPAVYTHKADKAKVEALREELHRDDYPQEHLLNTVMWHFQKGQQGIADISREAIVDRVRDRFWLQDTSPGRTQERDASVWRTIHREHQRTGRPLQGPRQPAHTSGQRLGHDLLEQLAELADAVERWSAGQEHQQGTGLRIRLHEEERDYGMGL